MDLGTDKWVQELHRVLLATDSISVPSKFVSGIFIFSQEMSKEIAAAMFAVYPRTLVNLILIGIAGEDV